jgi:hypothetical protein
MKSHWLPKLVLNNIPNDIFNKQLDPNNMLPPELSEVDQSSAKYKLGQKGYYY